MANGEEFSDEDEVNNPNPSYDELYNAFQELADDIKELAMKNATFMRNLISFSNELYH